MIGWEWGICFLRRGPSFVGMTIFGVVVFGMGDWVLTQGSLLCRDDNFGWVVGLEWVICFLRRGPSFVGMTILGVVVLEWVICFLRRGPSFVGMTIMGGWRAY